MTVAPRCRPECRWARQIIMEIPRVRDRLAGGMIAESAIAQAHDPAAGGSITRVERSSTARSRTLALTPGGTWAGVFELASVEAGQAAQRPTHRKPRPSWGDPVHRVMRQSSSTSQLCEVSLGISGANGLLG